MTSPKPTRQPADLADVLEMVLDKGIVINADIAITVNQTELLGVEVRAAIASFETAAEYGLAFPSGTDMRRVEQASGRDSLPEEEAVDLGIDASGGGATAESGRPAPRKRPAPRQPLNEDEGDDADEARRDDADPNGDGEAEAAETGDESDAGDTGDADEADETEGAPAAGGAEDEADGNEDDAAGNESDTDGDEDDADETEDDADEAGET